MSIVGEINMCVFACAELFLAVVRLLAAILFKDNGSRP